MDTDVEDSLKDNIQEEVGSDSEGASEDSEFFEEERAPRFLGSPLPDHLNPALDPDNTVLTSFEICGKNGACMVKPFK